jgi:cell division protein FtsI (penicillin-binding protein 3)
MDIRKDILWRVYLSYIGMIALGVAILVKAFLIQRVEGKHWRELGKKDHLKYIPVDAERGTIYSEDGNMLSTSVPIFDVFIDFGAEGLREKNGQRFKKYIDSLSISLSNLFNDKTAAAYKSELQAGYKNEDRYYPLKKKISFTEYKALREFPLVRLGRNKSGFIVSARDKRINPYVLLANRTIGLSREDSSKNVGLERSYDTVLKGKNGQRLMRYVAGAYLPVDGAEVEPENGSDIITTLDTYMQDVTEMALMKMVAGNNSLHGTAIVMETATGKIKAIANLGKQADGSYTEDLNYGIGKRTEPGSIFKLATALSLMEDGYVDDNTIVDCEGGVKNFYGLRIKDSHLGYGQLTVKDAFARSSNVAFAKLADQYYHNQPTKFLNHLHKFRLDMVTGIDVTASSGHPIIKKATSKSWAATTIPFMAHGYEQLVTPLHMLMLYNAIANNGKMMKPYLVNEVQQFGITVKKIEPVVLEQKIVSDKTLRQIKGCLLEVVDGAHGTAKKIKDSAYKIAGKTGTAVTALNNKGYNKGNKIYQASFIGYFPAAAPKYTVAVVIQNSNESKLVYGADVSGAVFKEISDRIYSKYIGVPKFTSPDNIDSAMYTFYGAKPELQTVFNFLNMRYVDAATNNTVRQANMKNNFTQLQASQNAMVPNTTTPSVVGMGLKDAINVLENKGLKVSISGRGKVMNQSLVAGTVFRKGQTISLALN